MTGEETPDPPEMLGSPALPAENLVTLADIIPQLLDRRVVFVGETHDRYEHHLNQLEIIRQLHERDIDLAIGMEFFQWPFQTYLDQWVAGELSEKDLIRTTEYYQRWRFDYRLYRPLLRFAREHRIPVVALNVPAELTRKVARGGLEALTAEERAQLPQQMDTSIADYRARIRRVFDYHPNDGERRFEHFLQSQVLWDEGMAERAADYLQAHPDRHMVVLAGSGHVAYRSAIPARLERRLAADTVVVVNVEPGQLEAGDADFILFPQRVALPPAGMLGAFLDERDGRVSFGEMADGSAARKAGLKRGDVLLAIDGEVVQSFSDVKLALLEQPAGATVSVRVERRNWLLGPRELTYEVTLQ